MIGGISKYQGKLVKSTQTFEGNPENFETMLTELKNAGFMVAIQNKMKDNKLIKKIKINHSF